MKKLLMGVAALTSLGTTGSAAAQCGELQVGAPNWSSGEIVAAIDSFILANGYGCTITKVVSPTKQVLPLAQGSNVPLIVGEFWTNGVDATTLAQAQEDGVLELPSKPFAFAGEAWYVSPAFAADYPELDTVEEVLARPDLFPSTTVEGTGAFYGCPVGVGWGCEFVNLNLYKSWNMEDLGWTLENPGSGEAQSAIIIDAYNTDGYWFGYYWTPTAVAINNELKKLDWDRPFVGTDVWGECYVAAEPASTCEYNETAFTESGVATAVTPDLAEYPAVYEYAQTREISMAALGAADAKVSEGMSIDEVAAWYLSNYEDEWVNWVDEEAADAVRAAL